MELELKLELFFQFNDYTRKHLVPLSYSFYQFSHLRVSGFPQIHDSVFEVDGSIGVQQVAVQFLTTLFPFNLVESLKRSEKCPTSTYATTAVHHESRIDIF